MGFSAKGVRCTQDALYQIPVPAIAHVILNNILHHFVVIYKVTEKYVTAADPAQGIIKYRMEEFKTIWDGILIITKPNEIYQHTEEGYESNFKRIFKLLSPERNTLIPSFIAAMVYTVLSLFTAVYVQKVIDEIIPNADLKLLNVMGIGMLFIIFFKVFFSWFRQMLLVYVSQKIDAKLILGYYRHILNLPQIFFDTRYIGEIISRVNDAVKIRYAISNVSMTIFVDTLIVLFSTAMIALYSMKLSSIPIIFLLFCVASICFIYRPMQKTQLSIMMRSAELQSQFVTSINGVSTIRSFLAKEYNNLITESIFTKILRLIFMSNKQQMFIGAFNDAAGSLAVVCILWYGGNLVMQRELSLGGLLSVYTLIGYLTTPMNRILGVQQVVQDALMASERLFEILTMETEDTIHKGCLQLSYKNVKGDIYFQNCSYQYGTRRKVLSEFNLSIHSGQITAIMGRSGSGKSTIFKLLHKNYDLNDGKILLDGIDINLIDTQSLRSIISIVAQETELFPVSIIENIAYGDQKPDIERIIAISRKLGIDKFVEELPSKYNAIISEHGASLSGGQKQMLSIARALYRNPKILLLDEPTSSLDNDFEMVLQDVLLELKKNNNTIVIITHRMNTIPYADKIVILESGKIVDPGACDKSVGIQGKYCLV